VKALGVHLYLSHGFHSDLFLLSFFFVAWPRGERGKSCRWLGAALRKSFVRGGVGAVSLLLCRVIQNSYLAGSRSIGWGHTTVTPT
jgi:hypothetical protein